MTIKDEEDGPATDGKESELQITTKSQGDLTTMEHSATLSMNAIATDSDNQTGKNEPNQAQNRREQSRDRSATLETQIGEQDAESNKAQSSRKDNIDSQVPLESAKGRLSELKRFTLWETKTHFYLVAYNTSQTLFRILKVDRIPGSQSQSTESQDRTSAGSPQNGKIGSVNETSTNTSSYKVEDANQQSSSFWSLNVTADSVVYTRTQISELLDMISEGNKSTGGLKEIGRFFGIVGFIRFTCTYYMVLISRRSVVGLLGGHYIYHCDETKIVPVCPSGILANMSGRTKILDQEEARLLHMFKQVDLGKNFYFSYTYDLTKTLQDNLTNSDIRTDSSSSHAQPHTAWGYNEKFVWNHHLLMPAFADTVHHLDTRSAASEWVLPLVYGFVDQAKLRVLNCTIHVTLIARRSRHFAGARFLKRGTDEKGHVANDVETEQIVSDALTTPFYAPSHRRGDGMRGPNPRYTSYVMHRGSIPVFWTQDSTNMSPRPPIEISVVDPFYSSAALHFDDMLRRYGHPIIVLNLIKSKEKQPREVKLLNAFGECVKYLNQFLPNDKRLRYIAWDMSRASKSRDQDVIGVLEDIAEETINATKFFHSGPEPNKFALSFDSNGQHIKARDTILLQSGVARVNCVDCLDRTNAAQFVIGKAAFGHQLYALGLLDHPSLPFDSDAIDMLTEMYHDLGDTIALQYGGSHLVNTMETYRKINQWSSHSRDMLEGLKRYYSNSFVDAEKQAAINLFLGVENDAPEFRPINPKQRRHYQKWYTPSHLEERKDVVAKQVRLQNIVESASNFWAEYYRPSLFTDLMRHHAFKMTAIHQQFANSPMLPKALSPPHIPSSPSSVRSASISTSSSGKAITSSAGRLHRLQNDSASLISHQTQTTMSPFTSRVPLPSASTAGSPQSNYTPSSPRGSISGQRAIIGGVKRWMSLNRGEGDINGSQSSTRKVSSNKIELTKTETKESDGKESIEKPIGMSHILSSMSAWPTWDEITGAQIGASTTEALLESLMSPNVSAEEVKEYASWLDQFRDVTFESGHNDAFTEPSALFPSTALGPSTAGLHNYQTQNLGQRKPATQKQRQQIAEADVRLYDHEVALAAGQIQMAKWNDGIFGTTLESGSTLLNPSAQTDLTNSSTFADDSEKQQSIEPALLHYPLTKNVLGAPASDAKVRAYTHWLAGHKQSSPIVLSTANS